MLPHIKTIIYASDLGEKTRPNFNMAAILANGQGAKIICVHVIEPLPDYIHSLIGDNLEKSKIDRSYAENAKAKEKVLLDRIEAFFKDEFSGKEITFTVEARVLTGQVEDVILRVAKKENADLIVMGSRTHSKLGRFMLGSSATKLIHTSVVPVLVIPIN